MPFYMGEVLIDGIDVGMGETFLEQIDELESEKVQLQESVETLTEEKSSLESEVSTLENEIATINQETQDGKTLVANAITEKGVTTESDATFEVMATNISNIPTGLTLIHTVTNKYGKDAFTTNIGCYPDVLYVKMVQRDDTSVVYHGVWIKSLVGETLYGSNTFRNSNGWVLYRDFPFYFNPIGSDGTAAYGGSNYANFKYYFDFYFYA